ncbi:MAG: hypothetical protein V7784_11420 [Oceanospirillaceae bacterium]
MTKLNTVKKMLYVAAALSTSAFLSMQVAANQTLAADLGTYPGSSLSAPAGKVSVSFDKETLSVKFNMNGITPSSKGGIHIHTGTSCDDASKVGGHYWSATLGDDTWKTTTWESDSNGNAKGELMVKTGYNYAENLSHALVIHNTEGSRIACGILVASAD